MTFQCSDPAIGTRSARILSALILVAGLGACSSASHSNATSSTTVPAPTLDACAVLTARDASRLAGSVMTKSTAPNDAPGTCKYGSPRSSKTVEIVAKSDPGDAFAQADYPAWVQSVEAAPGYAATPLANFADGATEVRSSVFDAILFRHGSVLVKIGVSPAATRASLRRAAATALQNL